MRGKVAYKKAHRTLSVTPTAQRQMITFLQDVIHDLENQQAEELETNTRPEENCRRQDAAVAAEPGCVTR